MGNSALPCRSSENTPGANAMGLLPAREDCSEPLRHKFHGNRREEQPHNLSEDLHPGRHADLTDGNYDERDVLADVLTAGRLYVLDCDYAKFTLLHKIMLAQSSFVCRVRNNSVFAVTEVRTLDVAAHRMGIVRDQVGRLGCKCKQDELPECIRLVQVDVGPCPQPYARGTEPYTLLIVTDLLEVSATVIALLYRYRWQVELFFRFFKHVLNCRHLLSHHS
jgi:hypothetical protein